jgi:hypothetical protein
MKKIIILLFLQISIVLNAQVYSYLTVGTSHGIDLNASSLPGFNAGYLIGIPFNKTWSLQTGMQFNSMKIDNNWSTSEVIGGQTLTFDLGRVAAFNFIELPVAVALKIPFFGGNSFVCNAGTYFSVFTGGETLLRSSSGFTDYALIRTYADPFGVGLMLGVGVDLNKFFVGIEGNLNLPDGYKPDGVIKTKLGIKL